MNPKLIHTMCFMLLLVMCSSVPVIAADKIKNCSSTEKAGLESVNDYVTTHLQNFLATDGAFLSTKYKDKLKKKWPKTTLKCSNADKYCANNGALAFQSIGNVLRYCTKEFNITKDDNFCHVVNVTIHELGHAVNIPIHARHNDAGLYNLHDAGTPDLVYRLGNEMESYCDSHPPGSSSSAVPVSSGKIGAKCKKNSDCNSKKCQGKGAVRECVCADNDDCPGSARCKKRLGKNYCIAKGTGPGDFCKKNSDCDIGVCQKKSCVCKTDSHCRSFYGVSDIRCVNRVGKNFCQETKQSAGESCHKNSDCTGNLKCKKKSCRK